MCVGRLTCPNWISDDDSCARTSTGNAALRNFSRSCQSTVVSTSSRRVPGDSDSTWVSEDSPKERVTRTPTVPSGSATPATSSVVSAVTESASVRSVTLLR